MVSVNCCSNSSLGEALLFSKGLKLFSWQKLSLPEQNGFGKKKYRNKFYQQVVSKVDVFVQNKSAI